MRDVHVVDKSLVEMLPVGLKDVSPIEKTFQEREASIGQEDEDEGEVADRRRSRRRSRDIGDQKKEDDERHDDAAHIARETTSRRTEIEKSKDKDGDKDSEKKLDVDEWDDTEVDIDKGTHDDKRIGSKHTVDAIHKIIDIKHTGEDDEDEQRLPQFERLQREKESKSHSSHLSGKTPEAGQRTYIVDKTDDRQQQGREHERKIGELVGSSIEKHSKEKDDAATTEDRTRMRTARIGHIDNVEPFGQKEIEQLYDNESHDSKDEIHRHKKRR